MRAQLSTVNHWNSNVRAELHDPALASTLFQRSLLETIVWCKPRADINDPANCLRSPELYPEGWSADDYTMSPDQAKPTIDKRHALLNLNAESIYPLMDLEGGRLLIFFPGTSLFEGAVALETGGFISQNEYPPWDTWVYYGTDRSSSNLGEFLISWIPPQFVKLVNEGFKVMSMEWLWWIDEIDLTA
jgi:hypothetical protein